MVLVLMCVLLHMPQAVAAREEAAVYKAENLRLQDELRSSKARLNAALEAQEELLRKNQDKHTQVPFIIRCSKY